METWYDPSPKFQPEVQPRVQPKVTVPSYIGENGLVGNWLFYDGAGDELHDFSGKENHGDVAGAVWRDGRYGWSLNFDGDDYVDMGDTLTVTRLTLIAWVNLDRDDVTEFYEVRGPTGGAGSRSYGLGNLDTGEFMIRVTTDSRGNVTEVSGGTTTTGEWRMVAATYDGSDIRLYVDGEEINSAAKTGDIYHESGDLFSLGCEYLSSGGANFLDGKLAWSFIYNRGLTAEEVGEHFESTKNIFR